MEAIEINNISRKKIARIASEPIKAAEAVNLIYVSDNVPGITRVRKDKGFIYYNGKEKITGKKQLDRLKQLVIPPAWENVWICKNENGHLQVTGLDDRNRKQYKYHPLWSALRSQTKYYRLAEFGKVLPAIRKRVKNDLMLPGLPREKILAIMVRLMERTHIRVGNSFYEKTYGSFGMTTLQNKHVEISGNEIKFIFKGKKGVSHNITLKNKRLASLVQNCKDIPGKELFQYIDDQGKRHPVDSGMINAYIKEISGGDFSSKDFRTWGGSIQALIVFRELGNCETSNETKKNIVHALDVVSQYLGNTRTVCKKYYVHPVIINLYESGKLFKYRAKKNSGKLNNELTQEEVSLLNILSKN